MRVLSSPVPHWVDPGDAFSRIFGSEENAVWLDSGTHASTGMSLMGAASRRVTACVDAGTITVDGDEQPGTVFDFLRNDLERNAVAAGSDFTLGWFGWLGYELRAQTMQTTQAMQTMQTTQTMQTGNTGQSRYPDAGLLFLDRGIVFDHATGTVTLLALGESWTGDALVWREGVLRQLAQLSSESADAPSSPVCAPNSSRSGPLCEPSSSRSDPVCGLSSSRSERIETVWAYTDDEYLRMIGECQAAIVAGDAYLLCLTTEARVDASPDPLATFRALRESSQTHHGAFLRMGELSILSASPEQFLQVSPSGRVQTSPIKGTRRRGSTEAEDARLKEELASSVKERAENLMIVDLMRNDIGRISSTGSVTVSSLLEVESYPQVHQLVSTVSGQLADGKSGIDAVFACFPAGSMTGAPKHSAVDILARLEQRPRGIYSGVLGYFGLDGRIDLSMVIRSIVIDTDGATVGTGGGITALSDPQEELDEVHLKAAALLRVLGAAVR